ncbi:MAG: hypothetical protein OSB19_02935 [Opitutaceae bacterium]|nr:hypothetical protein [Opitutaceae bacterium]
MANDRLIQLLKQRALIEEHLSWLESEISSLQSATIETPENDPIDNPIPANRLKSGEALGYVDFSSETPSKRLTDEPDPKAVLSDIYDKLGPETQDSVKDARKGCAMIFGCAFLVLAAIATWVSWKY